jgi:hypothetical protein
MHTLGVELHYQTRGHGNRVPPGSTTMKLTRMK